MVNVTSWPDKAKWDQSYLVKLNDMRVVQQFHDLHLAIDLLQVYRVQLGLVYDLYGHLLKDTAKLYS